jgi:hypothetical protein
VLEDVRSKELTGETSMLSLIGPQALEGAGRMIGRQIEPNSCFKVRVPSGEARVIAAVSSRFRSAHFIVPNEIARDTWKWTSERCGAAGIPVIGSAAVEMLRVAAGMPAPGAEVSDRFNPYDAGLVEFVSYSKGCYIGQEVIARIDTYQKIRRGLAGFATEAGPPGSLSDVPVLHAGSEVGEVTSWSPTPIRGHYYGLAVVRSSVTSPGTDVLLGGEADGVRATIKELPLGFA